MNAANSFARPFVAAQSNARILLVAYGILAAVIGMAYWSRTLDPAAMTIQSGRSNGIASSIAVLDAGGPPLIGSTKPFGEPWPATKGQFYFQVGTTDDPGSYVFLPLLGHWFGTTSPTQTIKWLFLGCFGILLALYPLLFYELLGSVAAALVAPALVLWRLGFVKDTDIYWITAWCVLLCVPALLLLASRRWTKRSVAALAAILVVASFASSIRSQSGFGIAIAGGVIALLREQTWRRRVVVVLIVIAAYGSVKPGMVWSAQRYRDHVLSAYLHVNPNYGQNFPSGHPFWHPAYLGLGYLPNRSGIAWNDTIAFNAAQRESPGAPYLSRGYERALRSLYLRFVEHHPGFALRTYWAKSLVVSYQAVTRFLSGLALLVVLSLFGPFRSLLGRGVLIALPSLVVTFGYPVMTIPFTQYSLGWLGSVGVLWILAASVVVALIQRWTMFVAAYLRRHPMRSVADLDVRIRQPLTPTLMKQSVWPFVRSRRIAIAVALGGVAALVGIWSGASGAARMDFYRQAWTPVVPGDTPPGKVIAHWEMASAIGRTWTHETSSVSTTVTGSSVSVLTAPYAGAMLDSPPVSLKPGTYKLLLQGRVDSGGLIVQAQEAATHRFLAQTAYYWQQPGFDSGTMATGLVLTEATTVQFVLVNWSNTNAPSHWSLSEATLVQPSAPDAPPKLPEQKARQ